MQKKNSSINQDTLGNIKIDAIRIRHGGVLGLCAFIHAHPYDVPKYVPSIFEHLGPHMNDPQPIPVIVYNNNNNIIKKFFNASWNYLF